MDLVWDDDSELFIAGPDTGPVRRELRSGSLVVGIRFRSGMAAAALGLPASELRDMRVPLDAVWSAGTSELPERLAAAPDARAKRRLLECAFLRRLPDIEPPDPLVLAAIGRLGKPGSRVGALSEELFVSERHLRRTFVPAVGYGPKTLDRVLRFQRFLALRPSNLAGAAGELGYSDQAHLTRETGRLSGLSPVQVVRNLETHAPGARHPRPWTSD